jgi:hypothetical protein
MGVENVRWWRVERGSLVDIFENTSENERNQRQIKSLDPISMIRDGRAVMQILQGSGI